VIVAVMTDLQVLFQLAFVEVFAAFFAAHKDVLSADDAVLFANRLRSCLFSFETRAYKQMADVRIQNPFLKGEG
jgi:hypothetical protein